MQVMLLGGDKLSHLKVTKGVIVKIVDEADMPVDAEGNRAEMVTAAEATIARMNIARLYEHYFNAISRTVRNLVLKTMVTSGIVTDGKVTVNKLSMINRSVIDEAYRPLLQYYEIISKEQFEQVVNFNEEDRLEHLTNVINRPIFTYYNINSQVDNVEAVKLLEAIFKPVYGPVTYRGNSGKMVTTTEKVRIAPLYVMLLDKIADDWSSVSSGKLQHFGVLAPITKSEKFAYPYRNSPVRTIGETEARIYGGYCGREAIAEMMDRSNNPATQRNIIWNLLNADKPSALEHVVDREYIPLGGARALQLQKHITAAAGSKAVYEPEDR